MSVSKSQFKRVATQKGVELNTIQRALFNYDNIKNNLCRAEEDVIYANKNLEIAKTSMKWAEKELEDLMK